MILRRMVNASGSEIERIFVHRIINIVYSLHEFCCDSLWSLIRHNFVLGERLVVAIGMARSKKIEKSQD